MSDIRNEHVNIESIQYLYRFSYILSMPQVESKVLTTRSAPPHFTLVKHISHKTSSNSDSGCCCPSFFMPKRILGVWRLLFS